MQTAVRYRTVCIAVAAAGTLAAAWTIGPDAALFAAHDIAGETTVWAFHASRLTVGAWVAITTWPRSALTRGPLCGMLATLPTAWVSQALPERGLTLPLSDLAVGAAIGLAAALTARRLTGLDSAATGTPPRE